MNRKTKGRNRWHGATRSAHDDSEHSILTGSAETHIGRKLSPCGGNLLVSCCTPWTEDDRKWFEAHPTRSFRLRRLFRDEYPLILSGCATHVVVRQLAPGMRDKVPCADGDVGRSLDALPKSDALCMVLWREYKTTVHGHSFRFSEAIREAMAMEATATGGVQ